MKKQKELKKLKIEKLTISKLGQNQIKGGGQGLITDRPLSEWSVYWCGG
ncbi:hypothetical protein [uncultured Aquimarina sp.]|nr:hypothetical protein [uncultured Aquimarina sp.]